MNRQTQSQLSESWAFMNDDDTGEAIEGHGQEQDIRTSSISEASYRDVRQPLRRSPRKQTPTPNMEEPSTDGNIAGTSTSNERSRRASSDRQSKHGSYFNPLPNDPPTPRTRNRKRRNGSEDNVAMQIQVARRQPRPRQRLQQQQPSHHSQDFDEPRDSQLFEGVWKLILWPILRSLWRIFTCTLNFISPLIPIVIGIWLIVGVSYFSVNFAFHSASNALSPLCNLPLVGWYWSSFCGPRLSTPSAPQELEELVHLQSTFEDVLSSSTSTVITSLPMDIAKSAVIVRELKHNVQFSELPSKSELWLELGNFDDSARDASTKLGSFGSSIGRAVDKIITTNHWTLRKLDSIANSDAERGLVEAFKDNIMSPFKPRVTRHDEVLEQYLGHADIIQEQLTDLILEAQALVKVLQFLDNQLDKIAFITKHDGVEITESRDELLARLWTFFGGNKHAIKQHDRGLVLLHDLSKYRQVAVAHVLATIRKLEAIKEGFQDLRQRIAEPGLDVGRRDMPLEWHIYNIQLGLERLEQKKIESNKVVNEDLARYMDGKGGRRDESRMIEGRATKATVAT